MEDKTPSISLQVSSDKTEVKFALPPSIATAEQFSAVIRLLMKAREAMLPIVIRNPPRSVPAEAIEIGGSWAVMTAHKPDTIALVLPQPGYAWLRFDLSAEQARRLSEALVSAQSRASPPSSKH